MPELPPERAFATWDPEPIAAASIGQVHRAITHDGRAVAVKVQYPGIAETIEADLGNVALLRRMLKITVPSQDVDALLAELRERVTEELDYRKEARNQQMFADYYRGHPTIVVPEIIGELSTRRVVTSELAEGARFAELAGWSQAERDLAAETIYRFVFRSLYEAHAFNGDPHPGNYLFHGGGRVTFLDFGLVKYFTDDEMRPLAAMVKHLCLDNDPEAFRRAMEEAGFLVRDAPLPTEMIVEHMAVFYDTVRVRGPVTMTGDYASAVTRRFFDFRSPLAAYAAIPRSYVILQRINLGLFALLGDLSATADWRRIAEEIWPFFQGPPSTPMGEAEAAWKSRTEACPPAPEIMGTVADQDDVRRIALSLPETVEAEDHFGFRVRNKAGRSGTKQFAWAWNERVTPGQPRVPRPDVLAVRVAGQAEKEMLLAADAGKFFTEPHYNGFPAVLVRLAAVGEEELRELITDAWRCQAPRDLVRSTGL